MTLPTYNTAFVDNVSTVTADFLNNYVRTQIPKAIDGVGGGIYTPSAAIDIRGTAGLKVNGSGSAARLQYGTRTLTRTQGSLLYNNDTGTWRVGVITLGTPSEQGMQDLERIPNGATLTTVTVYHDPTNATPPAGTAVQLLVFKRDITTGTPTQLGSTTTDPTAGASYGPYHSFAITSLSEVIDRTKYNYYAIVNGESGAGAANTDWYGCTCTFSVSDQDEAP